MVSNKETGGARARREGVQTHTKEEFARDPKRGRRRKQGVYGPEFAQERLQIVLAPASPG